MPDERANICIDLIIVDFPHFAVKAGGKRITQHKPEKEGGIPSHAESDETLVSVSPPKTTHIKQIINGVVAKVSCKMN